MKVVSTILKVLQYFNFLNTIYNCFKFLADCVFNAWDPCSKTCGSGIQRRDITIFSKNGGAPCIGPTLNYCNLGACSAGKIYKNI
jgi:hypothetical protein